jgi:hypothetical protein
MAKRNARPRKQKPRRGKSGKKKTAKKAVTRKVSRKASPKAKSRTPARKKRPAKARRAQTRSPRPKPAALSRPRRRLDEDIVIPSPPSTLGYTPKASSAESGHEMYNQRARQHSKGDPDLTAGDIDADWNEAYSSGEEAPGGDTPTPDQDVVDEIGRALGVEYEDAEELKGADKIVERDRHRWEYDPASSEDYRDRNKK